MLLVILCFSCKKGNSDPINFGYQYFQVNNGHFVVYAVIDIIHDDAVGVHDTNYYQIKEVVGESFLDEEDEEAHKLFRYYRSDTSNSWATKDVWVTKLTETTAEVVEENKRRIKMGFAISYNKFWNGNALNNDDKEECYYTNITDPYTLNNGTEVELTTIVEHSEFLTFIDYIRHFEVYAADIGKIYSFKKDIEINNSDTLDVMKGTELFYSMVDYGEE
jgi:hypothetical protein